MVGTTVAADNLGLAPIPPAPPLGELDAETGIDAPSLGLGLFTGLPAALRLACASLNAATDILCASETDESPRGRGRGVTPGLWVGL